MQIVIDIPEEVKHEVYAYGLSLCPSDKEQLINAIMNDKPLPKGHGRLIDADKLLNSFELSDFNGDEYDCINTACRIVNSMPTIIEADTEESKDRE